MRLGARITLCAALTVCALPAFGQTLKVAVSSPVTSIDPHYHNLAPNISLSTQIFNRLVEMDEHAHLVPGLATSWKLVAPDTWELKLRDAKFQNGNAFTADLLPETRRRSTLGDAAVGRKVNLELAKSDATIAYYNVLKSTGKVHL